MTSTDTATKPGGSRDFVLPGWDDQPAASPKKKSKTPKAEKLVKAANTARVAKAKYAEPIDPAGLEALRAEHARNTDTVATEPPAAKQPLLKKVLKGTLVAVIALAGGAGVFVGVLAAGQVEYAPAPDDTVRAAADGAVTGPDGTTPVDTNAGAMTVERMEPMHYFIPALGSYSEIVPSSTFTTTRYAEFRGLEIPGDSSKTAWFSDGGALADNAPGTEGTTLLASHVAWAGEWGVLRELRTLQGGELIYVKDAEGNLSAWKVIELSTRMHTEFPQEYWAADGARRLVVTTCVDYDSQKGFYTKNVFAIAAPVDPETGMPMPEFDPELEAPEGVGESATE